MVYASPCSFECLIGKIASLRSQWMTEEQNGLQICFAEQSGTTDEHLITCPTEGLMIET